MKILRAYKYYLFLIWAEIIDYLDWLIFNLILKLKSPNWLQKKIWYIVSPYGIGDTYFLCILTNEFLHQNGGEKVVIIVKNSHLPIGKLFPNDNIKLLYINSLDVRIIQKFGRFKLGCAFIGHPSFLKPSFDKILGDKDITLLTIYKQMFNITHDCYISKPQENILSSKSAQDRFLLLGLKHGKTVILLPDATSLDKLDLSFWLHLAKELKKQGWMVCVNSTHNNINQIEEAIPISFPLDEAISIAEMAGWVIASRNGFCDLISTATCKLSIIYIKQKWYAGTGLTGASLRKMGLSNRVFEYEINQDDDIKYIITHILQT
jgi:hypothetical protein